MASRSDEELPALTPDERARYEWQMWIDGHGEPGQRKLKNTSVLISRIGGVGGTVAYYLAAAGIGKLLLAHAGTIRPSDLNRQILMTTPALGTSRVDSASARLRELNPLVEIETVGENVSEENADRLVGKVDLVVDAAPLFAERHAMNRAAVRANKPLVEAGMYDYDGQLTTVLPGKTPCLACLWPNDPVHWKREFPVLGAMSGVVGALAAAEVVKCITGVGEPLTGRLLTMNLRSMSFRTLSIERDPNCRVCGALSPVG
ncbi:Molybdopterin-synthase adenylyltransferase [Caulifigura coniformis]|uniref:Molybdopterin-synthase adenylyltransferase n=1 Tax=Caulifigura coniformis TaxID=2527983 RepID=A0A517SJS1_9PLAN|nr:HesA/MoeB/ThiF family protein [Caulifigura coniformis]QDT56372.1 Molybdopterin-synthase adenylyltransferase [Caulifigura coniformis]